MSEVTIAGICLTVGFIAGVVVEFRYTIWHWVENLWSK